MDEKPNGAAFEEVAEQYHNEFQQAVTDENLQIPGHRVHEWRDAHPAYKRAMTRAAQQLVTRKVIRLGGV